MARQKKIKPLQEKEKEVIMVEPQVLDNLETEIDQKRIELEKLKKEIAETKDKIDTLPAREISEDEKFLSEKQVTMSAEKTALKAKIEKQKAIDNQLVTGKFINRRVPGQSAKLLYIKYETDLPKWWNFEDGQVYTIPRGFAEQINEYYHTPRFIKKDGPMDPTKPESQIHDVDTSNKKYAFVPINF